MFEPKVIPAPSRWDEPFGPDMTDTSVADVLSVPPLDGIDPETFSAPLTLHEIIKNDARLLDVKTGGIILREGDFGTSVFIVLEGAVRVAAGDGLMEEAVGGGAVARRGLMSAMAQLWRNHRYPEVRGLRDVASDTKVADDGAGTQQRLYFKDLEKTLARYPDAIELGAGSMFGEASALGRSPRTATVFAERPTRLLEIRWQGFRDILRRTPALKEEIEQLYRQRALKTHLRTSPLLGHLKESDLDVVAAKTLFESYGDYDWHIGFKRQGSRLSGGVDSEPLIAEEGHYADGLIILCAGFGRTSVRVDHGHHTISYLKPGDTFGSEEILHNKQHPAEPPLPLQSSLRAIGYAHVLRVPTKIVETYVLDRNGEGDSKEADRAALKGASPPGALDKGDTGLDQETLEFLVERRFINGTATMLIDMDRCTRCDDCVRACAAGHDNNPRFVRHGPVFDHFMVANACMHCSDPVCMIGCPTGAIHRRTEEGQVTINDATCIGCATCANSCPYDNIRMVRIRDDQNTMVLNQRTSAPVLKATKCDLCAEQMPAVSPACQNACPHDALIRIDMRDKKGLAEWLDR
jgi:Fe-S-cluster-containing dehydrogenase component/CRP-like cAMP-binding protein